MVQKWAILVIKSFKVKIKYVIWTFDLDAESRVGYARYGAPGYSLFSSGLPSRLRPIHANAASQRRPQLPNDTKPSSGTEKDIHT